jgi:electron transfer flavoprotein alpha subunit
MSQDVFVYVEVQNGAIRKITHQVMSVAQQLAGARGGSTVAIVAGSGVDAIASEASNLGASKVVVVEDAALADYTAEGTTAAVAGVIEAAGGGVFLIGNTSIGKDVGPRIAQRLGLGMISDVVEVVSTEGNGSFKRPIYAGKAYRTVAPTESNYVLSIRANSFPALEGAGTTAPIEKASVAIDATKIRVKVKEVQVREAGKVDLTEADIIVSGGMGVKGPEGFEFLKPLADTLGAALGSSRAAVLAGYIHPSHQVGQTGKTVSPSLYIACGISGAIQHKAGMSTSKTIVAINTDPNAPIFEFADYGIVGDLFQVVPPLIEEFKKVLD